MRVLIADDHAMFAESVASLLAANDEESEVSIRSSVASLRAATDQFIPDVAIVDWQLEDGDGAEVLSVLRERHPHTPAVVLTGVFKRHMVQDALRLGCTAFVTKDRAAKELLEALDKAKAGEPYFSPKALEAVLDPPATTADDDVLTARELQIVRAVARGLTNPQIARELFLSVNTVRNHLQRIATKMGVSSRLEVTLAAIRQGLIDLPCSDGGDAGVR